MKLHPPQTLLMQAKHTTSFRTYVLIEDLWCKTAYGCKAKGEQVDNGIYSMQHVKLSLETFRSQHYSKTLVLFMSLWSLHFLRDWQYYWQYYCGQLVLITDCFNDCPINLLLTNI